VCVIGAGVAGALLACLTLPDACLTDYDNSTDKRLDRDCVGWEVPVKAWGRQVLLSRL